MESVKLPIAAKWAFGKQAGEKVLLDPFNVRLMAKYKEGSKKFYWCSRTKDLSCPVCVTLDIAKDLITKITGEHNHLQTT